MASAARGRPAKKPSVQTNAVSEDIRKLQAEILLGLDSEEEDTSKPARSPSPEEGGVRELTEAAVLHASGEETIEDVVQLIFRDKQLQSLETPRSIDLDRLVNLEVLSLSHNLLEDVEPLSMLVALVEVNLSFNRIVDLEPLFDCEHLEKLFVSHNKVKSLEGLDTGCKRLKELAIYANCLDHHDSVLETLRKLPELRELHIGENPCSAAPTQRYALLRDLSGLEVFDGQKVNTSDRKFAAAFLEAASKDDGLDAEAPDAENNASLVRPVTAPSVCVRPPLPRPVSTSSNSSALAPLAPLPGQKLRSSRANRIDDLLTQSRDPSPEIADSRVPMLDLQTIDLSQPDQALASLTSHHAALHQCLDTMQMDRENLRFQVRLLEQDNLAEQVGSLQADVERLEFENRNRKAVDSENEQLLSRLAEVERALSKTIQKPDSSGASAAPRMFDDDDEEMSQLRWENKRLEKRLDQMKKYHDQLRHNFLSTQVRVKSSGGGQVAAEDLRHHDVADAELSTILTANENMLRKLQGEVSQTASGQPPMEATKPTKSSKSRRVDVLTIASEGSEDIEFHGKATDY